MTKALQLAFGSKRSFPYPVPDGLYYVQQTGGSDSNPGSSAQPFQTIGAAASVVVPGDIVIIRNGTYRETVTVPVSGNASNRIWFVAELGHTPYIVGLDLISVGGWSAYMGGPIYRKAVSLPVTGYAPGGISNNTSILANQIFREGEMQTESRWPKGVQSSADLLTLSYGSGGNDASGTRRNVAHFGSQSVTYGDDRDKFNWAFIKDNALLTSNGFPVVSGGLVGATMVSLGWFISESRTINYHVNQEIRWSGGDIWNTFPDPQPGIQVRKSYYLTNHLGLLTQDGEFHYDGTYLYYRQPGGGAPTGTFEFKARNWGFDLRSRSYITLKGLYFKGCEVATGNTNTTNCTIDTCRGSYLNHNVTHPIWKFQGYGMSQYMGTKLLGPNNLVKNSEFNIAASQCVWVGAGCRVENCLFDFFGYDGMWGAGVTFWGDDDVNNITVTKCTIRNAGRGCIDNGYAFVEEEVKDTIDNEISYNNLYNFGKLNQDCGAFYSWGYQNLAGLKFHHNWIHDLKAVRPPVGLTDGIMAAIYFDMGSGPTVGQTPSEIHHNVVWNVGNTPGFTSTECADVYTLPRYKYSTKGPAKYWNNTFAGDQKSYVTYQTTVVDEMRNNIFRKEFNNAWGAAATNIANCLMQATNPLFVGGYTDGDGRRFQLQSGSPARDQGIVRSGITNGFVGVAPDIGAYEYGGEVWTAGYVPV
ncbi:MAG: right-handed parallel beta-helix repeat-containing protein [Chryseolinea sp.]